MLAQFPQTQVAVRAPLRLVGAWVRTSMRDAGTDCPRLWERFVPWMQSLYGVNGNAFACPSYGVSTDVDMGQAAFTYWAAIELEPRFADPATWPEGIRTLDLAGGLYAGTGVPSLDRLSEAYTGMYGPWIQAQHELALDMQRPCFEYYDARFLQDGSLEVHVPVRKVKQEA